MEVFDRLVTDHTRRLVGGLIETAKAEGAELSLADGERLTRLCAASPLTLRILQQQPAGVEKVLSPRGTTRKRRRARLTEQLAPISGSPDENLTALRQAHRVELARLALHHLEHGESILELSEDISDMADATLNRTFEITEKTVESERGPKPPDSSMAVLALGKHGGEELNFSSDVDLMFVYRVDDPEREGDDAAKWYDRQASLLCNELQTVTANGFLYRVDTRLRPEGTRGALVPSILAVEIYYHNFGELWERQALLKLRPVAGGRALGRDVAKLLEPFTHRKYIDEVGIAETLRTMDRTRKRMGERYTLEEERQRDIKIRRGGIRDVEFVSQGIQILYGGQYPEVRVSNTATALQRMFESGLLHSHDHRTLTEGYALLRRVEHALQIREGRQNYQIPQETEQLEPYAWIAGFEDSAALREALDVTCERIHDIYRGIFGRDEWKDRTSVLLDESTATEESLTVLTEHGFIEPKAACNRLRRLATDTEHTYLQAKTQRRFQAILPRLLACASEESEPDRCLQQFERILGGVGSRSAFYDIMKDQPQSMQILIAVAGGSEFLTECLHRNPSLIETLGRQSYLRDALTEEALSDYGRELALAHPGEEPLERLVRLRNGAEMRVGVRFLLRLSELGSIVSELSVLAELILKELYEASRIEPDVTEEDDLLVVGLGKLGGRELNIASDLDLACFYGDPGGGDPARALTRSSNEYYNQWVRRLLELGGKRFSRGTLYELDLRLRPYGRNSPQATTLDSLAEYFRDKAWFWERMAYSRARPVQGAPRWRKAFETWREEAIFGPGFTPQNLMDLHDMRKRIERQKGSQVIKAGPGGLIDVEFASQAVALAHGTEHPGLREGSTVHLLEEAARLGLVDPVRAESLVKGYLFLRDIENRIRLIKHASLDSLPEGEAELDAVARRIFPPDSSERTGAALVARVQSVTSSLRQDYVAVLEAIL